MSATWLTHVWHYPVARTPYDELLRLALHGRLGGLVPLACAGGLVILLVRRRGRRIPT
jgi:hypothetical protein